MNKAEILAVRAEIDAKLDALENFDFEDDDLTDEDVDAFTNLVFHLGATPHVKHATLQQVERLEQMVPLTLAVYGRLVLYGYHNYGGSDAVLNLVTYDMPQFLMSITKLSETRARQSASGRGEFGRPTLAKYRDRCALLEAENAELRHAKESVAT